MTLVLTVNGPDSAWTVADRRLSYAGRPTKEDARKIMLLETTDGLAILSYAGLGSTAKGIEPADWMSKVLRGRNLPLEQSLGVLAEAIKKQLPRHLLGLPVHGEPTHSVIASGFVNNESRVYTIDMELEGRSRYHFRYTRHVIKETISKNRMVAARFVGGGSGALYLSRERGWKRSLLQLVKANDRGQISSRVLADHLARLNWRVHLGLADRSVGPRCIVAWRHRKGGRHHNGGGGQQFYTGVTRDRDSPSLPHIANGMDLHALYEVMMPHFIRSMRPGEPTVELDKDAINADLALLPDQPDENLR